MSFKDQMRADFLQVMANTDEYGETITYTPDGAAPRSILAVVDRNRLDRLDLDGGRTVTKQCEIMISAHPLDGISEVKRNRDKVTLPVYEGGQNADWVVSDVIAKDPAVWHLLITR